MTQTFDLTHDIGDELYLIDATLSDWRADPEAAEQALATVPLAALVKLSTLALATIKTLEPEVYTHFLTKFQLNDPHIDSAE